MIVESLQEITAADASKGIYRDLSPADNQANTNVSFYNLLQAVDSNIQASDKAIQDYVLDKGVSTHDLMIAMAKAEHSLKLAVEVRNKISEAYDQVARMRI